MKASIFDQLQAQAFRAGIKTRTNQSMNWFSKRVKELGTINRRQLLKDGRLKDVGKDEVVGSMYMYFYDPKLKKTLPYYDRFPMTIVVGPAKGGFYGINLHYLSPFVRARFLDKLMEIAPKNINDKTNLKITYETLKGVQKYKEFKPCFKHYLTKHLKSNLVRVPMSEWEIAAFLPTQQFTKVKDQSVWRASRRQINGK